MSYQGKVKIEGDHFGQYFPEVNVSPEPWKEVDFFEQYLETLEHDATFKAYSNLTCDRKYYITTIGAHSNGTAAFAKIKQEDDSPQKPKLEPELELFPSHLVLVGCTKCYMYMMLPSNESACFNCHKRAQTLDELRKKFERH